LKTRVSVLWIFMALALSAESALFLMGTGAIGVVFLCVHTSLPDDEKPPFLFASCFSPA